MKPPASPLLFGSLALVTAALLTSCVDTYVDPYPTTVTTTYRTGYEVHTLPPGYRTEVIDGSSYYVHNGTYYRPRSGRYVVVDSPRERARHHHHPSRIVTTLPRGYRTIDYRGTRYYQAGGAYYRPSGSGYIIVDSPY